MVFAVSFCDGSSPTCLADHIELSMSTGRHPLFTWSVPYLKGPRLFILYTADLADVVQHVNFHAYADDNQLYLHWSVVGTI